MTGFGSLQTRQRSRSTHGRRGHRDGGGGSVATTLFRDTTYSTYGLIESIKRGAVALPDIQRPFVWPASKVRDLLDSLDV